MPRLLAIIPEDGWAMVREEKTIFFVRPPFRRSERVPVPEATLADAVSLHGYEARLDEPEESWSGAVERIREIMTRVHENRSLPSDAEMLSRMLRSGPPSVLTGLLDRIENDWLATGDLRAAERALRALLAEDRVKTSKVLIDRALVLHQDVVALAGEGRLIVLLPQSTDRYEPKLLNDLAQQAPESLVWSRALCAATMIELRRRLYPWFFPGFGLRERQERLRRASMREPVPPSAPLFLHPAEFSRFLTHVWARAEWYTHLKGAMGANYEGSGFGTLLAEHIERELNRGLWLEATEAGASVEMAAALGATVVPMHRLEFSLLGLTNMGARLLSWLSGALARANPPLAFDLPDRDHPARELARLDGEALRRMRGLVAAMTLGVDDASSGAPEASEACRRMLEEAGALTRPDGKLTLRAQTPPISLPDTAVDAVTSMRVLRDLVAGGTATTPVPDPADRSPDFPSIVVGELASS